MAHIPSHEDFEREHSAKHPTPEPDCFACKLDTVGLQFTYGRKDFHGPTLNERVADHHAANEAQGRKLGRDYESATRWV